MLIPKASLTAVGYQTMLIIVGGQNNRVGLIHRTEQNGMECSVGLKHGTEPLINHSIYNAYYTIT